MLVCLGALLLTGCNGAGLGGDDGTSTSSDAAGGEESEPSGWPIDVPPDDAEVVDRDLVARVVAELDIHLRDLYRAPAREGEAGELTEALARSIYTDDAVDSALERVGDWHDLVHDDVSTPRSAIVEVATADVDCVDALVRRDLGPVLDLPDDQAIDTWEVTLVVVDDSDNGTTWRMARDQPGTTAPTTCS